MEIVERLQKDFNGGVPNVRAMDVAGVYMGLDDLDECFKWLERAFAREGYFNFGFFRFNPQMEKVRRDPRFNAFLKKANLPLESVK